MNPREIIVSISLKGIDYVFTILMRLPSLSKHAIKFSAAVFTEIICELNLTNG